MAETFATARIRLLRSLRDNHGWKASDVNLKVLHVTSPDGHVRLWFKAQAVHFTVAKDGRHDAGEMRTTGLEMRGLNAQSLLDEAAMLLARDVLEV